MNRTRSFYGTLARLDVQPGKLDAVRDLLRAWERELQPSIEGARDGYLLVPDGRQDEVYLIALFDDEPTYRANADSPRQDAWYRQLRELLRSDPDWIDGHFEQSAPAAAVQ